MSCMNDTKVTWVRYGLTALVFYGLVEYPRGVRISRLLLKQIVGVYATPPFTRQCKDRRLENQTKTKEIYIYNYGPLVLPT